MYIYIYIYIYIYTNYRNQHMLFISYASRALHCATCYASSTRYQLICTMCYSHAACIILHTIRCCCVLTMLDNSYYGIIMELLGRLLALSLSLNSSIFLCILPSLC